MCGILAIFRSSLSEADLRKIMIQNALKLRHRGPDWSGYKVYGSNAIAHERLAIIDPDSGSQPLVSPDGNIIVAANGEIYNYKELYEELGGIDFYPPKTGSDCEVIIPLYLKHGRDFPRFLRGMFSFVLYDRRDDSFFVLRDHMGITPLYAGYGADGSIWFASEMKALTDVVARVDVFPPGHAYDSELEGKGGFVQWYNPVWYDSTYLPTERVELLNIRNAFEMAVKRRMMSDVPWGVLLSGGLDSSLVASIASRLSRRDPNNEWPRLHSFSIGLENSPDLAAAAEVAKFVGTVHHSYVFTVQEGMDAVREVIYHLETYDVTTVRAATPMFLMSRKIKARGVKMVLSGEGADEIFGGYLYFHKAPDSKEFHAETVDKLRGLFQYDCLRANKATSAWGVEVRVPFLDQDFLDVAMTINPEDKMIVKDGEGRRMEKWILRKAFDDPADPYLPAKILWRQKEQFSDGVGYGWIDALRDHANADVSDKVFSAAENRFPYNTPLTKEAYYYRDIFDRFFPSPSAAATVPGGPSIACSTPRAMEWDASFRGRADPSGRAVAAVHESAYVEGFTPQAEGEGGRGAKRKVDGEPVQNGKDK
ncbi:asparagine synthetase [Nannochloropsis gaditana]|uniref:asparagine synthase (glutamine-hydrolyzing) n=1 Tax=Nannochloropsis gaditana TaxID=72520 RepID=W7TS38_9STRA|nr:asparagine synthetase [Nannochloropsis gaditana]